MYLLVILAIFTGGALTLFAARAQVLEAKGVFSAVSRESALVLNNVLLSVAAFVVFVGTIWPLVAEMALGRKLSVGAPFFDAAFTPFMVVLALVLPFGSVLAWKRGTLGRAWRLLWPGAVLAVALGSLAFAMQTGRSALGPVGVALGVWVIAGAGLDLWARTGREGVGARLGRLTRLPRADWGKAVAHAGLGVSVFAIAAHLAWMEEDIRVAQVGDRFAVGAYEVELRAVEEIEGPNYLSQRAEMAVWRGGREVAVVHPEKRYYPVAGMPTTEAGIDNGITRDLYLVIGDAQAGGGYAVRTYIKPFSNWIWGGAILMALGGLLSLSDRRLRVAAGAGRVPASTVAAE